MKNTLWNEEYRPNKLDDCIIPKRIEKVLKGYVKNEDVPNLLFYGPAGCCKPPTAKAIVSELDADYLFINGSDETGKAECDRLTHNAQDSLKAYIEQFSDNCRFIFTANTPSRIIKPIHSRCLCFDFNIESKEKPELMVKLLKSIINILHDKKVSYDIQALQTLIFKRFPDYRSIVNDIQAYATAYNTIDIGIATFNENSIVEPLYGFIKSKDFDGVRKWLYETNFSQDEIFTALWKGITNLDKRIIPTVIVILADYQFKADRAIIPQVNILACLVEIMNEVQNG